MFLGSSRNLVFYFLFLFLFSILFSNEEESVSFYQDVLLNPMDLNTTKIEYLQEFLNLKGSNLKSFIDFRKHNYFSSIYDLTNFGFSEFEIEKLSPYIVVKKITNKDFYFYGKTAFIQRRFDNSETNRFIFQFEVGAGNLKFYSGFKTFTNILESDAYSITNLRYNFTFEDKYLKFLLGHYQLSYGQGLLFGDSSLNFIDSINKTPVYKKSKGIITFKSLTDDFDNDKNYDYINGIALNLKFFEDTFFPFLSTGEQIVKKTNKLYNFTMGFLYKDDSEAGILWNNIYPLTNQFSFFYDYQGLDFFQPYGEIAISEGRSIEQGLIFNFDRTKITILGFYCDTNFNSFNDRNILGYKNNFKGFLSGLKFDINNFYFQTYYLLYSRTTNEVYFNKLEFKGGVYLKSDFFSTIFFELKTRYSTLSTTTNLKNYIYFDVGFLKNNLVFQFRYQNLIEFIREEMGNFFLLRVILQPLKFLNIKGRIVYYNAESYYSALFYPEESFYRGDFYLKAYYGEGFEYSLFSEVKIKDFLDFGIGYSIDKQETKIGCYLEGEW